MKRYIVTIEIKGKQVPVGIIEGKTSANSRFTYSEEYLADKNSYPISISLPLQKEPFTADKTKTFFEGLLPEGFTRKAIANNMHFADDDYVPILYGLGRECLGAIRITSDNDDLGDEYYEQLSIDQVKELAAEGATKSTEILIKTHLSLTGASGKVGLYYDENDKKWYLPYGLAPSTYIVKQSHVRLDGIVTNEQISMLAASKCGIDIPQSFIVNMDKGLDSDVLFATKRYDRLIDDSSVILDGLRKPYRLHQEDFAQAMGIAAADKYEKPGDNYAKKMFDLVRTNSMKPLEDQLKLWNRIVFNYVIGNTDGHIKNYSLLYNSDMRGRSLSPAYDIVSTIIYESSTRNCSFAIGNTQSIDDIKEDDFKTMASQVGIGEKLAMKNYYEILEKFENAIKEAADELEDMGFGNAQSIGERILASREKLL